MRGSVLAVLAVLCLSSLAVHAESDGAVSLLELQSQQVHLHPVNPQARDNALKGLLTPQPESMMGTRPSAPQFEPTTMMGSGTANSFMGAPELLMAQHAGNAVAAQTGTPAPNFGSVPPSMYFTSPFDYEADDAANPAGNAAPDTWFERVGKAKDMHKRTYDSVSQGKVPRMGWMGTGVHRPINHLTEAQELSDIDPWRQLASQQYAFFRSPARNPEMRGSTLRRLQKSEVAGFDHTNGQYGLPLGTGLRGVGTATMGLTKFDYGPFGLGPVHPNPLAHAYNTAVQSTVNQAAAPVGMTATLGYSPPVMPFS